MKQTVQFYEFHNAFEDMNREDHFSYKGLITLFDYLELIEDETDIQIELDVISLCCEYTEYKDLKEFQDDYGREYEDMEDIENSTTVIMIDETSFIIQDF